MVERKNYAKFRRELKETCPWLGEQEIYKKWRILVDGACWQIHQVPTKGCDGKYHYVYLTIVVPTNDFYVGRHSKDNMNDNYHGSGDEIKKLEAQGVELVTIPLEFFRSYKMSLVAEGEIVDRMFLIEPGVLNKVPGGDDSRHNEPETPTAPSNPILPEVEESTVETPFGDIVNVPVMKGNPNVVASPKKVEKPSCPEASPKKKGFWSFERLGVRVGDKLEYVPDPTISAEVVDSESIVKCKGKKMTLTNMTKHLAGRERIGNTLNFWRWNGELLIDIRNTKEAMGL